MVNNKFQSTQPKRAATMGVIGQTDAANISIHAAQEGCDWHANGFEDVLTDYFNPRSPRGLRHFITSPEYQFISYFNPRSPRGLRPCSVVCCNKFCAYFNPRSPRGLRQKPAACRWLMFKYFNPRSPRGLRQQAAKGGNAGNQFQSTQPKRAATAIAKRLKS